MISSFHMALKTLYLLCYVLFLSLSSVHAQDASSQQNAGSKLTKAPVLKNFVQAVYPVKAFQDKIEGYVIMKLTIDQQGKVVSIENDEINPPNYGLEESAVKAAQSFVFEPAEIDHQPAMVQIKYRYVFKLNQVKEEPVLKTEKKVEEKKELTTAEQVEINEPLPQIDGPTGVLEGILLESGSQEPVAGVRVILEGFDIGRLSDERGRFRFIGVPVGRVSLVVNDNEFDQALGSFVVKANRKNDVATLYLVRKKFSDEHKIKGEAPKRVATSYRIKQDEITQIAGIDSDALKSIQDLPSIRRMPFDMGGLFFRGTGQGSLYLYNQSYQTPFHLNGIRTSLPTAMISSLEVMPDFGVSYDRTGNGVVQMNLIDAPQDRLRGKFEYNAYEASAYLGGPLSTRSTLSGSFRQGLFMDHLKLVNPEQFLKYGVNVPRTSDAHLRYTYKSNTHQLELFGSWGGGFGNRTLSNPDQYDPAKRGLLRDQQQQVQLFLQLKSRISQDLYHQLNASYALLDFNKDFSQLKKSSALLNTLFLQSQLKRVFSSRLTLIGGFEQVTERISYQYQNLSPPLEGDAWRIDSSLERVNSNHQRWTLSPSLWSELEWKLARLHVIPGVRLSYWSDTNQYLAQPKLNVRYQPAFGTMLKMSAGLYMQRIDPRFLDANVGNTELKHQQHINTSLGIEQRFTESISMDLTAYYRQVNDRLSRSLDPSLRYQSNGSAQSYGAELLVRYDIDHRFYGWVSYSLTQVNVKDPYLKAQSQRKSDLDQVHHLSVLGGWKIIPALSLNLRWRYISGASYSGLNTVLFDSDQGKNVAGTSFVNEYRFNDLHQLELRVDYAFAIKHWKLTAYGQIYNLYGHRSGEKAYFDASQINQIQSVQSLPTWGSLGLRGEF
jgi:TonB family protein